MSFVEDQAKAWNEIPELTKLSDQPQESVNGPGATLAATELLREELPDLLARHNIRTMLDVGCGDWNWMSRVSLDLDGYVGWDVSAAQIETNRATFGRSFPLAFECVNLLDVDPARIPRVDLILARHVLIHFPNEHIAAVLDKLRSSGSRFLLASHWPGTENSDRQPEGFRYRGYMERTVNMEGEPFNFFPAIDGIIEPGQGVKHVLAERHYLALFELQRTRVAAGGTGQQPTWDTLTKMDMPPNPLLPRARVTVTDPDTNVTTIMGPPEVGQLPEDDAELAEAQRRIREQQPGGQLRHLGVHPVNTPLDPDCEHTRHYRTHTADGVMVERCSHCHGVIDETKSDAVEGEGISFMGALSRFGEKVQRLADDEQMANQEQLDKLQKKLVLVDKDKLKQVRGNLNDAIEAARVGSTLADAWLCIGAMAATLDTILREMIRDE